MIEKFKKNLPLIAVLLGVFAFVTLLFSAVTMTTEYGSESVLEGYRVAFGYAQKLSYGSTTVEQEITEFSFMALLTYLLPLVGVVGAYLADEKKNKVFYIVAVACFVVAALFFFLMPTWIAFVKDMKESMKEVDITPAFGAIVGAICSILAALCLVPDLMKSLKAAAAPAPTAASEPETKA